MEVWPVEWNRGRADVFAVGGSLHNLVLRVDNAEFAPLAEAPWQKRYLRTPDDRLPRHLQLLGGEWPCVPFGSSRHDPVHHGHGADGEWTLIERDSNRVALGIDYPAGHPVKRLTREVRGLDSQPAIELSLAIEARKDCRLPIGVHPVFKLGESTRISACVFEYGSTFPRVFEPGVSMHLPGENFASDGRVPTAEVTVNVLSEPSRAREELVELFNTGGAVELAYPEEGMVACLEWDRDVFPHCMLWISNTGRAAEPWNNQFRGLGVEPVNSYFDIDDESPDPEACGVPIKAGGRLATTYRIHARRS